MTYKEIIDDAKSHGVNFDLDYDKQQNVWGILEKLAKKYKYKYGRDNRVGEDFFHWLVRSQINETDSSSSGAYQAPFGVSKKDTILLNNMKETINEGFALYKDGNRKDGQWSGGKLVKTFEKEEDAKAAQKAAKAKETPDENMYIKKVHAVPEGKKVQTVEQYKVMVDGKAHGDGKAMSKESADKLVASLKAKTPKGTSKTIKAVEVKVAKSKVMKEGREYNYTTESYVFENKKYTKVIPMTETHVYTKQALTEALNRKKKI